MSVVNQENLKVSLPRTGPDDFWDTVFETFAGEDRRKWRYLAMLALRENNGWPLEHIARVFGHKPGHITRCLMGIKEELRSAFSEPRFVASDPHSLSDPHSAKEERLEGGG